MPSKKMPSQVNSNVTPPPMIPVSQPLLNNVQAQINSNVGNSLFSNIVPQQQANISQVNQSNLAHQQVYFPVQQQMNNFNQAPQMSNSNFAQQQGMTFNSSNNYSQMPQFNPVSNGMYGRQMQGMVHNPINQPAIFNDDEPLIEKVK